MKTKASSMNSQVFKDLRFIPLINSVKYSFSNSNKLITGNINVMNKKIYQSIIFLFIALMVVII